MTTVQQCWDHYAKEQLAKTVDPQANLRLWRRLDWFADKDASSPMEVDDYVSFRGVKASTVNRELALLRAALRVAARDGLIKAAPYVKSVPGARPRERACSLAEVERLLEAADAGGNWREMVLIRLGLATGARPGAITDLVWDRVHKNEIDFRLPGGSHRMKRRVIAPMTDMARLAIQIARRHRDGPYVLHWHGRKLSNPRRTFARIAGRAGVPDCSPHVMRHTVASLLLEDGEDLLRVSRLLGHANTKITEETYFQHTVPWLKTATDRLESLYSTTRSKTGRPCGRRRRTPRSPNLSGASLQTRSSTKGS